MAIVKTLDILLRGRTEQLGTDLKTAQKQFQSFQSKVKSIIVPAISTAVFFASIQSARAQLDGLAKRSVRLGIDPAELGALERAARLADVAVGELSMANKSLSSNIVKALAGGKQQAKVFNDLGLSADKLSKMNFSNQLIAIGGALDGVQDRAERTTLAFSLLGKAGVKVLPLILGGAEDLRKSLKRTRELGGIFESNDLKAVERANDLWSEFTMTLGYAWQRMAVELSPALSELFTDLINAIKPGTAFSGLLASIGDVVKILLVPLQILVFVIGELSQLFGSTIGRIVGWAVAIAVVGRVTASLITTLKALRVIQVSLLAIESARASLNLATAGRVALAIGAFATVIAAVNKIEANIGGVFKETEKLGGQFEETAKAGMKLSQINPSSAARGSQEAFESVYSVKIQNPIEKLIDVNRQGNELLGEINDKIQQGEDLGNDIVENFE